MARIFTDCYEMIREIDRELKVCGITVPVKHYQNKALEGSDRNTKELIGVNFIITRPFLKKKEMLDFVFKSEGDQIERYCYQEIKDRTSGQSLNPGNSYLIRMDLWQKLMSRDKEGRFDYTYSERINEFDQVGNVIGCLLDDPHSRRAIISIWDPNDSYGIAGYQTRVPCSISYQFLIRNNKLIVLYYIRSNDYFKHFAIDIWLANALQEFIVHSLKNEYPDLSCGPLNYYGGSLHAYNEDISRWVIY